MADYANPNAIVETQWVADHHNDSNVRIVEVDVDTNAYDEGHIPGAVGWNWHTQLQQGVVRDLVTRDELDKLLGSSGIDPHTTDFSSDVVVVSCESINSVSLRTEVMKVSGPRRLEGRRAD